MNLPQHTRVPGSWSTYENNAKVLRVTLRHPCLVPRTYAASLYEELLAAVRQRLVFLAVVRQRLFFFRYKKKFPEMSV